MNDTLFDISRQNELPPPPHKVLYAVLNWGLGHAARSVYIIEQLLGAGYEVSLASDGEAMSLLRREFPGLPVLVLPGYGITYSKSGWMLPAHLFFQLPKWINTLQTEKKIIRRYTDENGIQSVISDNRFGAYSPICTNIYITHQLRVLSGIFTPVTTCFHRRIMRHYDWIWVPDTSGGDNLSGKLSHGIRRKNVRYIGWISAKTPLPVPAQYDITAVLSGPEPQRSMLERQIEKVFLRLPDKKCLLVRGKFDEKKPENPKKPFTVYSVLSGKELNELVNASKIIISRSGYSSVMDMEILNKKVIYIPTPGQKEQEYLARYLHEKKGYPVVKQDNRLIDNLLSVIQSILHNSP